MTHDHDSTKPALPISEARCLGERWGIICNRRESCARYTAGFDFQFGETWEHPKHLHGKCTDFIEDTAAH